MSRRLPNLVARWSAGWIRERRRTLGPGARPLSAVEKDAMTGYFEPALLDDVRIASVPRIEGPWFVRPLEAFGLSLDVAFEGAAGITFGDLIVISSLAPGTSVPSALLFHELVHVVQYRVQGIDGFARAYVHGWWDNERSYRAIPHEVEAYTYESLFRRGEQFFVTCGLPEPP